MNVQHDLVSVVIPVYNASSLLSPTLESVLSQTYGRIEIVAVDDGSSDGSIDVLRGYGDRISVIAQDNSGAASARNNGVLAARGEWIAFMDADDIWSKEKIERQLAVSAGVAWSYTDSQFMGGVNDGRCDSELNIKHSGDVFEELLRNNFIGTSSVMIRRDVFLESGGFNRTLKSIEDWELWIRVAKRHPVAYLDEALVKYRIHSASMSRSARNTLPDHMRVIDSVFAQDGIAGSVRHLESAARAKSLGICSSIAEEEGDMGFALTCSMRACMHQPLDIRTWGNAGKNLAKYLLWCGGLRLVAGIWVILSDLMTTRHQLLAGLV